jgi:alanine racemase
LPDGAGAGARVTAPGECYDPWLEVFPDALAHNADQVACLAGGRPILAVVKNNAYGLGLTRVGPILDALPQVAGLAVVNLADAHALRDAGATKPILHMGLTTVVDGVELARRGVRLAPFTDDAPALLREVARSVGGPVPVHLYLDTGMGRLGMPAHRAPAWIETLAGSGDVIIEGTFTTFVEEPEVDARQLDRLRELAGEASRRGVALGRLHAASSNGVLHGGEEALLDAVRPGLVLYGAHPDEAGRARAALRPAFALRARVARVERLRAGDSVSYGARYVADRPTWAATLPVGHADGFPRGAVGGAEVLIGERTYRVIGAVSASHTVVEVGAERSVKVGDVATLVGPDHPAVHPNEVARRSGVSVYDVLMHLSARLPGVVVAGAVASGG